jgi:hypothetical protein
MQGARSRRRLAEAIVAPSGDVVISAGSVGSGSSLLSAGARVTDQGTVTVLG